VSARGDELLQPAHAVGEPRRDLVARAERNVSARQNDEHVRRAILDAAR
jgi:hypothetical protein